MPGPFRGSWRTAADGRYAGILDIGPDGCFVESMAGPGPGERVQVCVTIQHQCVTLTGRVIYTDRVQGFAVAFTDNARPEIDELHRLLDLAVAKVGHVNHRT